MNRIVVAHDGIEITYNESRNQWEFELRGRSRSCDSLMVARAAIDAPEPRPKNPFKRFSAYIYERWEKESFQPVEITSVIGRSYGGLAFDVWTIDSKGNRSKKNTSELYAISPTNDEKIAEIKRLTVEETRLANKRDEIHKSLAGIVDQLGDAKTEV